MHAISQQRLINNYDSSSRKLEVLLKILWNQPSLAREDQRKDSNCNKIQAPLIFLANLNSTVFFFSKFHELRMSFSCFSRVTHKFSPSSCFTHKPFASFAKKISIFLKPNPVLGRVLTRIGLLQGTRTTGEIQ